MKTPTYQDLIRLHKLHQFKDWIILTLFIAIDILLTVWLIRVYKSITLYLFFLFALFALLRPFINELKFIFMKKEEISDLPGTAKIEHLSVYQIQTVISDLLQPHCNKEIPSIYVTPSKEAEAFVVDSFFFNFIKPMNAVYISRTLIRYLNIDEFKAILAHEFAHFFNFMSPISRGRLPIFLFTFLLPLFTGVEAKLPILLNVVIAILTPLFTWIFIGRVINNRSKTQEHLCDLESAKICGVLNTINGLLVVAKYQEYERMIYKSILRKIKKDNTLSISNLEWILNEIKEKMPDKLINKAEVAKIIDSIFDSKALEEKKKEMADDQIFKEDEIIDNFLLNLFHSEKFRIINWSIFEIEKADMKISEKEFPLLIKALEDNKEKQLFDIEPDNSELTVRGSHPTFGERILFLDNALKSNTTN